MLIPLVLVAAAYFLVPILVPLWRGRERTNYRGVPAASGLGLAIIFPAALALVLEGPRQQHGSLFLAAILLFTILGLLDDFLGNGAKGFRGHFSRPGISTGVVKAVGGIAAAVAVGFHIASGWPGLIADVLLISLGANFLNLLDLRPGRAAKCFVLFSLILVAFGRGMLTPLLWLTAAVLGYLPWDLREQVMLGDAGSNPLGAALGLAAAAVLPTWVKLLAASILIVLNVLSERVSFSEVIAKNRVLNFLDRLGR